MAVQNFQKKKKRKKGLTHVNNNSKTIKNTVKTRILLEKESMELQNLLSDPPLRSHFQPQKWVQSMK